MKKFLPLLLILPLLFGACSQEAAKTEYTHTVPANALQVVWANPQTLMEKAGDAVPALTGWIGRLTGVDQTAPIYLFRSPALPGMAATLKISDLTLWKVTVAALAAEGTCTAPAEAEGYSSVNLKDKGIQLAYNDGTLLAVFARNDEEVGKLQPAIAALMRQGAAQSIHSHPHFAAMTAQKGDLRMLATPNALPFDLRSILNHPQGTWLLGRMTFENGHIYATVQQADFQGDTHEVNQPFIPTSQRELQAAMMRMMSGHPFNIELTGEALLTLTNLRALMDFNPDEETRRLYDLVTKIERINARGDNRRTSFTVVLREKNVNALKQLVNYTEWFVKF